MKNRLLFLRIFIMVIFIGCSPEIVTNFQFENPTLIIKKIKVEKPLSDTIGGFVMNFDEKGRPINYTSLDETSVFREFVYGNNQQLESLYFYGTQTITYNYLYSDGRLSEQSGENLSGQTTQIFYYNDITVQSVLFNNEIYSSTNFFTFENEERTRLIEIKTYDGGGVLKHHYLFDYDENNNVIKETHYIDSPVDDTLILFSTIEQTFDDRNNPLKNSDHFRWMEAWYLSHNESNTFIENISRHSLNNIVSRTSTNQFGISSHQTFDYQYNNFNYPISATRLTNGEFEQRNYTFTYHED